MLLPARYLVITISTGTDPSNKLWYIDAAALPVDASTGALDLAPYDRTKGATAQPLPIVRLVDEFIAAFSITASEGPIWTLTTDLNATRSKCAPLLPTSSKSQQLPGTVPQPCHRPVNT